MSRFLLVLALRRAAAEWRLLAGLVFGSVVAVALLASAPVYIRALDDLGLQSALREVPRQELDILVRSNSVHASGTDYQARDQAVREAFEARLAGQIWGTRRYIKSATFYVTPAGTARRTDAGRPRANFQAVSALDEHSTLVEGEGLPPAGSAPRDERVVDVLVSEQTADALAVHIGDTFELEAFWIDAPLDYRACVAGIIRADAPADHFWSGQDYFAVPRGEWDTYLFFVRQDQLLGQLANDIPGLRVDAAWTFLVEPGAINAGNAQEVLAAVRGGIATVRQRLPGPELRTRLESVLDRYGQRLVFARVPLFILIFQVEAIVLYYVAMVAAMVVERQSGEIAQVKSRGASRTQVLAIYLFQSLLIGGVALALGPPIATMGVAAMGLTPPFHELSEGSLLTVTPGPAMYGLALAGAALAVLALLLPAYRASRLSIVQQRQRAARQVRPARATRYLADVALVLLAGFLFWRTQQQSFINVRLTGERSADPVLLLSPALFTVTVALLVLHVLPLAMRVLQRLTTPLGGAAAPLALTYMARSPGHHGRLVFLLILATSLGLFAASFGATLGRSYDDRALYTVGSDIRYDFATASTIRDVTTLADSMAREAGVEAASPALRLAGAVRGSQQDIPLSILGVEPGRFAAAAWFRPDFAGTPFQELLAGVAAGGQNLSGLEFDATTERFGLWVRFPDPQPGVLVVARLHDAEGHYFDYLLGVTADSPPPFAEGGTPGLALWDSFGRLVAEGPALAGWNFIEAEVGRPRHPSAVRGTSRPFFAAPMPPVSLVTIYFEKGRDPNAPPTTTVVIDELTVFEADGAARVLDGFEGDLRDWEAAQAGATGLPDAFEPLADNPREGSLAASYTFVNDMLGAHGIRRATGPAELPVLVDSDLLARTNKREGDTLQFETGGYQLTARIAGEFDLFPTFEPDRGSFVVADLQALRALLNRMPGESAVRGTNEVWVRTTPSGLPAETLHLPGTARPSAVLEAAAERRRFTLDPLVETGWQGVLIIAFFTIATLSSFGMLIYSYLAAQARKLDFAVLRTMGLSARQILGLVGLEQALIVLIGVTAGSFVGGRLGLLLLPSLELTEAGTRVVPPYVLDIDWFSVSLAYGVIAAVFMFSVVLLVVFFSHLALHRVLRIGEA